MPLIRPNQSLNKLLVPLVFLSILGFTYYHNCVSQECTRSVPDRVVYYDQKQPSSGAISGVSGRVFQGEKIRGYIQSQADDSDPKPLSMSPDCQNKMWGVSTTINAPTDSIMKVVKQRDVCLVIVADRKTPIEQYLTLEKQQSTVSFLSVEEQEALQDWEITSLLPWNHFGRKNLGYLYAIQHGASVVFDFDDDNELISG